MDEEIENEISRVADIVGVSVEDIVKEMATYQEKGVSDWGALSIVKGQYSNVLRGDKAKIPVIPLGWGDPRQVNDATVFDVIALVNLGQLDGRGWHLERLSFWSDDRRDRSAMLKAVPLNQVAALTVLYKQASGKITVLSREWEQYEGEQVDPVALIESLEPVPIDDLWDYLNTPVLVQGWVGRKFDTDYGGGIELMDKFSGGVTIWLPEGTPELNEGDAVAVIGIPTKREGRDITISAKAVYAEEE